MIAKEDDMDETRKAMEQSLQSLRRKLKHELETAGIGTTGRLDELQNVVAEARESHTEDAYLAAYGTLHSALEAGDTHDALIVERELRHGVFMDFSPSDASGIETRRIIDAARPFAEKEIELFGAARKARGEEPRTPPRMTDEERSAKLRAAGYEPTGVLDDLNAALDPLLGDTFDPEKFARAWDLLFEALEQGHVHDSLIAGSRVARYSMDHWGARPDIPFLRMAAFMPHIKAAGLWGASA